MTANRTAWLGLTLLLFTGACQLLVGIEETSEGTASGGSAGSGGMAGTGGMADAAPDVTGGSAGTGDAGPDATPLPELKCDWQVPSVRRLALDNSASPLSERRWDEIHVDSWSEYLIVTLEHDKGSGVRDNYLVLTSGDHAPSVTTLPDSGFLQGVKVVRGSDGAATIGVVTLEVELVDGGKLGRFVLREYRPSGALTLVETTILTESFEVGDEAGSDLLFDADEHGVSFLASARNGVEATMWSGSQPRGGTPVTMNFIKSVSDADADDIRVLALFKDGDRAWGCIGSVEGDSVELVEVPSDAAVTATVHALPVEMVLGFDLLAGGSAHVAFLEEFDPTGVIPPVVRIGTWPTEDFANLQVDQLHVLDVPIHAFPVTEFTPIFEQGALLMAGGNLSAVDTLTFLYIDVNGNLRGRLDSKVAGPGTAIWSGAAGWLDNEGVMKTTFNVAWVERSGSSGAEEDVLMTDVLRCAP